MEKIKEILQELKPEFDFENSTDYIEDGYLDSFDMVSLVSTLEDEFKMLIDALDIVPDNFASVDAIAKIIKKNGGAI